MKPRITIGVLVVAALFMGAAFIVALTPPKLDPVALRSAAVADTQNGEKIFWASGCAGCHAAPGSEGDQRLVLSGGLPIESDFGTFHAPNISPDEGYGIGDWTFYEFANALKKGVGRHGENLYPALPYTSYVRMTNQDVRDLHGYIMTLPKSTEPSKPHDIAFPFNIRLALSFWKRLYFSDQARVALADATPEVMRGQYLAEGPGHCGECHTPRNALGGLKYGDWLAGGPNPDGEGMIPDITPGSKAIGDWTASQIADYLETGFTPDYDTVGGSMVEVQQNVSHLTRADLEAIGAYLKAVPAR
ncbi:mono/diheme cytochrome c family protein [Martelella radicis]|uniref:Mono/diheme cytochrome c family protein n=2 Tax=Martelella radicis TaxID=1397476 RepID=A0A7W6KNW9_9HYPH|nr:mono/diheme cytochrome c family protein [Martelella radicis]